MKLFNYEVTLEKKEKKKLSDLIEERDELMMDAYSKTRKACKTTGETICKLLDIYEDPATGEAEKGLALWGIRYVSKELIELGEKREEV